MEFGADFYYINMQSSMKQAGATSGCDRLRVVLVRARNPLNIGAAARAMTNFGFERGACEGGTVFERG